MRIEINSGENFFGTALLTGAAIAIGIKESALGPGISSSEGIGRISYDGPLGSAEFESWQHFEAAGMRPDSVIKETKSKIDPPPFPSMPDFQRMRLPSGQRARRYMLAVALL